MLDPPFCHNFVFLFFTQLLIFFFFIIHTVYFKKLHLIPNFTILYNYILLTHFLFHANLYDFSGIKIEPTDSEL